MRRTLLVILAATLPHVGVSGAPGDNADELSRLRESAQAAFASQDFAGAATILEQLIEARPEDPLPRYNLACARSRAGESARAIEALHASIERGFVDFHHMDRDPDLAPIRDADEYRLIVLGWPELLDARGVADMESAREALGPRYSYAADPALRLNIASSFDRQSTDEALAEVRRTTDWADRALFGAVAGPAPDRPDHWVSLILPTPEHFRGFVPVQGVGGIYDRDRRILVAQDLGPSLRHEYLHVLHHRVMDRLGQDHAIWVQEGLGAIVEDMGATAAGDGPVPSWRTNIVKRLEGRARLVPWRSFFAMSRDRFVRNRPNANYAQARAIVLFLADQGVLDDWLAAYVATYDEDPTGGAAFATVFDRPIAQVERDFRTWVRSLPEVAEEIRPGMPSLGVVIDPGQGEGPRVVESARRAADGDRLRVGDVITSVAGRATRTPEDLVRVLAEEDVGEVVEVAIRRGTLRLTLRITLVPFTRDMGDMEWAPGAPAP